MNIVIFSWRAVGHPLAGGAELVTFEHSKAWARSGHQVTIFTSYYPGGSQDELQEGVRIIRRGDASLGVRLYGTWWYLFDKHPKINLVVDEFHGIPFFTPLFVRVRKLAFIHEVAKKVWFLNFNLVIAVVGYLLEPLVFKLIYRSVPFMTVSNSTKEELMEWLIPEKQIEVINNGISVPAEIKKIPKEKIPTVIFLGALSKDKGVEDAVKAFALLQRKDYQFWIVGKGEESYLRYLKKMVVDLGIKQQTKFWGFVSDQEKFSLLAKAHLLLFPSVKEGWGLVVIEAARMGTPTVGYNVSGLKDSVQDQRTGILVEYGDVQGLAQAIKLLFKDKEIYRKFSKNALRWSQEFSWDRSCEKSLSLIESLTKS